MLSFVNKNMFQNFVYIANLHYFRSIFFRQHGLGYANEKSILLQFNSTIFDLFQVKLSHSTMALGHAIQNSIYLNEIETKFDLFYSIQINFI